MIVDNRGDASHEGQSCRHVQVKMEGLTEPANKHQIEKETGQADSNKIIIIIIMHFDRCLIKQVNQPNFSLPHRANHPNLHN